MPRDSTSVLEALPDKLDIKRHSPSFLYISTNPAIQQAFSKTCLVNLISKDTHLVFYISASLGMSTRLLEALPGKLNIKRHSPSILYILTSLAIQQAYSKPYLVNLISKDTHLVFFISRQASGFNKRSQSLAW